MPEPTFDTASSSTTRREALATLAVCGCCMVTTTAGASDVAPSSAAAPDDRAPPAKAQRSDLGPVTDFAGDGVFDKFARSKQVLVFRKGDTLHAASSLCTHKRCILKKSPDASAALKCPCHQSDFDAEGIPLGGPAKTSLTRFAIAIENGHVFVDTTKSFAEKDWGKDGAKATVPVAP